MFDDAHRFHDQAVEIDRLLTGADRPGKIGDCAENLRQLVHRPPNLPQVFLDLGITALLPEKLRERRDGHQGRTCIMDETGRERAHGVHLFRLKQRVAQWRLAHLPCNGLFLIGHD